MSDLPALLPLDEHNRKLRSNVHPLDWQNPKPSSRYHLAIIGGGTAGLVTAAGAAGLGARVALIENELLGGDCLNVGCVPSKALIAAARQVKQKRDAASTPMSIEKLGAEFSQAMELMRAKRAGISPHDSAARFRDLGVDVFFGKASFVDHQTLLVKSENGERTEITFAKAVIATGARASAPQIDGLDDVEYLTNETLFSLTELPKRMAVVGGGPIGCEMAQVFARFGAEVSLFERSDRILPREDRDASEILAGRMKADGVKLVLGSSDMRLSKSGDGIEVQCKVAGRSKTVLVDRLLIAVGRAPNFESLGLERVGVSYDRKGVTVNDFQQTTNPKIFAAGDVCSKFQFTHAADFQARIVIQNALFAVGPFGRKKASDLVIPWVTYTSPEIAHVGLTAEEAEAKNIAIDTYTQNFDGVDRAILEGQTSGFVRVHTQKGKDKILGATIVCEHAGELMAEVVLSMTKGIGLQGIGQSIHPYPTMVDAIRKLGDQFNRTRLTPFSKKMLAMLRWLNVGK